MILGLGICRFKGAQDKPERPRPQALNPQPLNPNGFLIIRLCPNDSKERGVPAQTRIGKSRLGGVLEASTEGLWVSSSEHAIDAFLPCAFPVQDKSLLNSVPFVVFSRLLMDEILHLFGSLSNCNS